ncbi:MAG TPA: Rieske (2Fe-2S) protein, partial [Brevundimonas sp.]
MQATLPSRLYGCPEAWARERSAVFGRAWLFLGHEAEAPAAGDWIASDVAGHRLMALRGKDGVLRAFHNV